MGIRIKKVLGWGLTDVKSEQFRLTDERFNLDVIAEYKESPDEMEKRFIDWAMDDKTKDERIQVLTEANGGNAEWIYGEKFLSPASAENFFIYNDEFGLSKVALFILVKASSQ